MVLSSSCNLGQQSAGKVFSKRKHLKGHHYHGIRKVERIQRKKSRELAMDTKETLPNRYKNSTLSQPYHGGLSYDEANVQPEYPQETQEPKIESHPICPPRVNTDSTSPRRLKKGLSNHETDQEFSKEIIPNQSPFLKLKKGLRETNKAVLIPLLSATYILSALASVLLINEFKELDDDVFSAVAGFFIILALLFTISFFVVSLIVLIATIFD